MKTITHEDLKHLESKNVVLFSAPWCMPCQNLKKQITTEMNVAVCDIEENMEAAEEFNITTVPTVIVFEDSNIKTRAMGYAECLATVKTEALA